MATLGHSSWHMDDIDDALAADFDGSLSGLGIELGTASFNMSETLLALPSLKGGSNQSQQRIKKNRPLQAEEETAPTTIKRFCNDPSQPQKHSTSAPDLRHCADGMLLLQTAVSGQTVSPPGSTSSSCIGQSIGGATFQYVLGAATSIATKINEKTMTYLNQGQSYEIKLKKLGDLTEMQGKLLKSVVRVGFQERRLQYMEREQMEQWSFQHPQERILDVDIPLSYGVYDVVSYPKLLNAFEFVWDPTKETGVFVRLNCISTEFTPKKHGGEKGVPFRLVVETFNQDAGGQSLKFHSASCQVKVFKPKGADRKHKTDREKMSKRPLSEQDLYQPSFDCTFFTDCVPQAYSSPSESPNKMAQQVIPLSAAYPASPEVPLVPPPSSQTPTQNQVQHRVSLSPSTSVTGSDSDEAGPLSSEASVQETTEWLKLNRFQNILPNLSSFSGNDILRLNKSDLITICGVAEGIRLYNLLHSKGIRPALTLYIGSSLDDPFVPLFLERTTAYHLKAAISIGMNVPSSVNLFLKGPGGIRISVTDELVRNLGEESAFILDISDKIVLMTPFKTEDRE